MDYDDLAELRDAFNERLVLGQPRFFLRSQPDPEVLARDEEARAAILEDIIVRRPQVFVPRRAGGCLGSTCGRRAEEGIPKWYAAKFGYTTRTSGVRLPQVIGEITSKGFPESGLHPIYALAIDGLPHDRLLLYHMENGLRSLLDRDGLRSLLDRDGLRLRQHAQGVLHPGNRTAIAETFEFVHADANCNRLFQLFDQYARRLDAARRWVRSLVTVFDILRNQVGENGREETLQDGDYHPGGCCSNFHCSSVVNL